MSINRRTIIKGAIATGVAAQTIKISAAVAQAGPIRVGFLTVKTGPLASGGLQMEQGLLTFFRERNNMLAGRPVELHTQDTAGNPAQARTKTQELVERLKVSCIIGPLAAFEALAIDDYIRSSQTPILTVAGAEDMTQRKPNPWLVRPSSTSAQPSHPLGDYAAKDLKLKRVAVLADDFAFGHENVAGFQRVFEDNGGKVVQKLFTPLNAPDYGTYIAQLKSNLDGVYTGHAGSNGFKFIKQLREYGEQDPDPRRLHAGRRSRCCSKWATTRWAPSPVTGTPPNSTSRSTSASSPRSRRNTRSIRASMRPRPISAARCSITRSSRSRATSRTSRPS